MNLSRMFANAIVRRIAYVVVALLFAWVGIGKAHATTYCGVPSGSDARAAAGGDDTYSHSELALAACRTASQKAHNNAISGGWFREWSGLVCQLDGSLKRVKAQWNTYVRHEQAANCGQTTVTSPAGQPTGYGWNWTTLGCPPPTVWDEERQICHDPDACLAHNNEEGFKGVGVIVRPKSDMCVGNCQWKIVAGTGQGCVTIGGVGGGAQACTGEYEFTGAACTVNPSPLVQTPEQAKETKEEECLQAGSGQTMCVKPNGENCYMLAGNVSSICWKPGETGEKSQGPNQQQRDAGEQAQPPRQPPVPPETFNPPSPPVTTNQTGGSQGSTIIITTTVNRTTTSGTTPPGTPAPPGGKPQAGSDDGNKNASTGGGSCEDPPITTGDQALRQIATQAWATRCAVEAGNSVNVTGDIGDCNSPFTVEGAAKDKNVQTLRAMRAQICPHEGSTGDGYDGSALDGPDDASGMDLFVEGDEISGELDDSGLGFSRGCPAMPTINVFGTSIQFNNGPMCDWLELGGLLVLALAALASIRLMVSGG